jgi:hypothetical protein
VILRHAQDLRHQMTQTEPVDQSTLDQGSSESHGQTSAKVGERVPVV